MMAEKVYNHLRLTVFPPLRSLLLFVPVLSTPSIKKCIWKVKSQPSYILHAMGAVDWDGLANAIYNESRKEIGTVI